MRPIMQPDLPSPPHMATYTISTARGVSGFFPAPGPETETVEDEPPRYLFPKSSTDLVNLLKAFYERPDFETIRVHVIEEWLFSPEVKAALKPIWEERARARRIYYDRERGQLRLKGMGSSPLHDSVSKWARVFFRKSSATES